MSSLESTTNLKAKYVLHLNILSTFSLISVSDAGKQLSVPYSFATFGPRQEVTSLSLKDRNYLPYVASVKKLMAQSKQYDLDLHVWRTARDLFDPRQSLPSS